MSLSRTPVISSSSARTCFLVLKIALPTVDTDPGVDDALAMSVLHVRFKELHLLTETNSLLAIASPEIEILAFVVSFGTPCIYSIHIVSPPMSDRREHGLGGFLVRFLIRICLGNAHAFSASISSKYTKRSVGISSNTRRIVTFSRITLLRESLSLSEVLRVLSAGNYITQPTFMAGTHISTLNEGPRN
jgi:hypothetical protein